MSSGEIAHCLAMGFFSDSVCVVDNCYWPGNETDLLVVNRRLQVVDVEIKISRADLKRDRAKEKWYGVGDGYRLDAQGRTRRERVPLEWPRRIWKHYYAMPAAIWKPEWLEDCQAASGVILVDFTRDEGLENRRSTMARRSPAFWHHRVIKRAKPRPEYTPIGAKALVEISRLASVRMWEAYNRVNEVARDYRAQLELARAPVKA